MQKPVKKKILPLVVILWVLAILSIIPIIAIIMVFFGLTIFDPIDTYSDFGDEEYVERLEKEMIAHAEIAVRTQHDNIVEFEKPYLVNINEPDNFYQVKGSCKTEIVNPFRSTQWATYLVDLKKTDNGFLAVKVIVEYELGGLKTIPLKEPN